MTSQAPTSRGPTDAGLTARVLSSEWFPIETAPKDGSMMVLGNEFIVWMGKYVRIYPSGYVPTCPWTFDMLNTNYAGRDVISLFPTHWMPLPTPPTNKGAA